MTDSSDFKTAAAKLLAQHSARRQARPASPEPIPAPPPQQVVITTVGSQQRRVSSAGSELSSVIRGTAIPGLAVLGGSIMVFLVPETIFGMWFNGVFGISAGAFFGYMLVREL